MEVSHSVKYMIAYLRRLYYTLVSTSGLDEALTVEVFHSLEPKMAYLQRLDEYFLEHVDEVFTISAPGNIRACNIRR